MSVIFVALNYNLVLEVPDHLDPYSDGINDNNGDDDYVDDDENHGKDQGDDH